MVRVPLTVGSYTAHSFIASAQRSCNLIGEANPEDAPSKYTFYPTPGLTPLGVPPGNAAVRCLYRATNNQLFAAIGSGIYYVSPTWVLTLVGTLAFNTTPVKMGDNNTTIVVVDGTTAGYTIDMGTHAFAPIVDPAFYGSNFVGFVDTFLIFNKPGTAIFYTSDSNAVTFDPLFFAAKTGYSDLLAGIAVQQRQIWLVGQQATSEIWFNAGGANFPFQILPGPFVEHATIAPYSLATMGGTLFWLSHSPTGTSIVVMTEGYRTVPISTQALSAEIATYFKSDAIGFCYEQSGHSFYWLKFPTTGKDWVYDTSTKQWHERFWTDAGGNEQSHRANCAAFCYGVNVVGDRLNGQLYKLDQTNYTDFGGPINRIRGLPHMLNDGKRVFYTSFIADMECGSGTVPSPVLNLRWSDTRGATYGNYVAQSLGAPGKFLTQPQWNRLGMARDRVFELSWNAPVQTALNGAFVEYEPSES